MRYLVNLKSSSNWAFFTPNNLRPKTYGILQGLYIFDLQIDLTKNQHLNGYPHTFLNNASSYRYGYNGMEKDDEAFGNGNSYTTEFRQYDPRLGRWKSLDPLAANAPSWNPYRFAFNNPLTYTDMNGLFETRKAARKYRREKKNVKGRIRKNKEGNYSIRSGKKGGTEYTAGDDSGKFDKISDTHKNDGVLESAFVTPGKEQKSLKGKIPSIKDNGIRKTNTSIKVDGIIDITSKSVSTASIITEASKYVTKETLEPPKLKSKEFPTTESFQKYSKKATKTLKTLSKVGKVLGVTSVIVNAVDTGKNFSEGNYKKGLISLGKTVGDVVMMGVKTNPVGLVLNVAWTIITW